MVKRRQAEGVESTEKVTQIHHFYSLLLYINEVALD